MPDRFAFSPRCDRHLFFILEDEAVGQPQRALLLSTDFAYGPKMNESLSYTDYMRALQEEPFIYEGKIFGRRILG